MKKSTTYTIPAYRLKDLIAGLGVVLESHGDAYIEDIILDVQAVGFNTAKTIRTSAVDITLKANADD